MFAQIDNFIRVLRDVKDAYLIGHRDGYEGRRRRGGDGRGQADENGPTLEIASNYEGLRDQLVLIADMIKADAGDVVEARNELQRMVGLRTRGPQWGGVKEDQVRGDMTTAPLRVEGG